MADDETTTTPETRDQLEALSLEALRKLASDAEVEGRSKMDKAGLIDALAGDTIAGDGSSARASRASSAALRDDRKLAELQAKIAAGEADEDEIAEHDELAQARRRRPAAIVTDEARARAEERAEAEAAPLGRRTRTSDRAPAVEVSDAVRERAAAIRQAELEASGDARDRARVEARTVGIGARPAEG